MTDAMFGGCGTRRENAAAKVIMINSINLGLSMPVSFVLYSAGNRSQNQKESRQTTSPKENFTAFLNIGPSKTNV